MRWTRVLIIAGLLVAPWGGVIPLGAWGVVKDWSGLNWPGAAWAQDDDDGDDDDDDDDDGDDDSGAGDDDDDRPATPGPSARPAEAAVPPAPTQRRALAEQARGEIVVLDLSEEDLARLIAQGFAQIEARGIPGLGATARRLRVPSGLTLDQARGVVRGLASAQGADFNHYYRTDEGELLPDAPLTCDGPHCGAFAQVGWPVPASRALDCGASVTVGVIDTGLNADHATFAEARIERLRVSDAALDPSRLEHGTAVAAILLGHPASRSPGLVPHIRLVAADAFHREGSDERADVFALADALGQLAEAGARVVNLSFSGPANATLEAAINRLVRDQGITVIAAAGNGGPAAPPSYPAAYDGVIAVTAVDQAGAVWRRAQRGDHVVLAAPGVEVWTAASISGARAKTGTSFAAPFVTAAAALMVQGDPDLTPAEIAARLTLAARDLGEAGPDPVFGHGMVNFAGLCPAK